MPITAACPGPGRRWWQTAKQIVPEDIEAVIAQYKTIKVPVLIIWGAEDEVVPLEVGKNFKRDIPGSELVDPAPLRPYPPGRGTAGDQAGDYGVFEKVMLKD